MATQQDYYYRKSGQIPAFGDWENVNELPITQYFECARQAGLLRCTCSGECTANYAGHDLYQKPVSRRVYAAPAADQNNKTRGMNRAYQQTQEQRKQVKVSKEQPRNQHLSNKHNQKHYDSKPVNLNAQRSSVNVKPVDEDLYKIPSDQLLRTSKRKRMLGFFSRCMVPPCAA